MASPNPFTQPSNFIDLLNIQQDSLPFTCVELGSSQVPLFSSQQDCTFGDETPAERRERRKWTPTNDILLISAWLDTSKDPVVANEQKSGAFWQRIAAYIAASPKAAGREIRKAGQCKQRWQKINDVVCKFCGAYEATGRERSSGENESDVLKRAHKIFYNDHKKKFTLEHAWKELRNDQKWCDLSLTKIDGSCKRRRCDDGSQSSSTRTDGRVNLDDDHSDVNTRPPGVKASKARGKKPMTPTSEKLSEFQTMWSIKEKDLAMKEKLSKMSILDSLIGKTEPLSEIEVALKDKLITDMLSNS
ncbi:Glutathione S-transferase T3 [Cardamine amara subsp. amara]|uniref:Glutathione S-transferase T3 n=1 Tax=Cardamine amara subsp. amara TaxID=228776 RepID=A0ABD0Z9N3_CARAN